MVQLLPLRSAKAVLTNIKYNLQCTEFPNFARIPSGHFHMNEKQQHQQTGEDTARWPLAGDIWHRRSCKAASGRNKKQFNNSKMNLAYSSHAWSCNFLRARIDLHHTSIMNMSTNTVLTSTFGKDFKVKNCRLITEEVWRRYL